MLRDIIQRNRSYRRFDESEQISREQLESWVDLARYAASGRNMQPLKYLISNQSETNALIFDTLKWAGYLTEWDGPATGERPTAYIVQFLDTTIASNYFCDDGIAAQNILLGAVEAGFGGCILRAFNRKQLNEALKTPEHLEIINVLALGKPAETVQIDEMTHDDVKYWRDDQGIHHVPKRPLKDIII